MLIWWGCLRDTWDGPLPALCPGGGVLWLPSLCLAFNICGLLHISGLPSPVYWRLAKVGEGWLQAEGPVRSIECGPLVLRSLSLLKPWLLPWKPPKGG